MKKNEPKWKREEKKVRIITLISKETLELLAPYAAKGDRGRIIEEAVKAYLKKE